MKLNKGNMNRGRCRFYVTLLLLLFCAVALLLFYSVQQELEEQKKIFFRCEQQQQSLSEQLKSEVEQKFRMKQNQEHEINEKLDAQRKCEEGLKEQNDMHNQKLTDAAIEYEKLKQAFTNLQSEYEKMEKGFEDKKKSQIEDFNALEKKLESLQIELNNSRGVQDAQIKSWKDKYENLAKEKSSLELLLKADDTNEKHVEQILVLEKLIRDYGKNCNYRPDSLPESLQVNKFPSSSTPRQKTSHEKSFDQQILVSPGVYKIPVTERKLQQRIVPKQMKKSSAEADQQAGPRVSPLSAPRKQTSTESNKILEANAHLKQVDTNKTSPTSSSTTSQRPPLALPEGAKTNQRKLPENVAPVPNFDAFLKEEEADNDVAAMQHKQNGVEAEGLSSDKNAANNNDNNSNNRYANVVNDMAADVSKQKVQKKSAKLLAHQQNNLDSGAHEVKDNEVGNDNNLNAMGNNDNNNFFDVDLNKNNKNLNMDAPLAKPQARQHDEFDDNPDDDMLDGIGANADEANNMDPSKNDGKHQLQDHHHLLEDDDNENNLNNEVAGDQGKEFPGDGIHLEEINQEDEDEDDYVNLAARQQGAQAIRN